MTVPLPRPKAVLFDLFHTLALAPTPDLAGEPPISQILGLSGGDWQRLYYEEDVDWEFEDVPAFVATLGLD